MRDASLMIAFRQRKRKKNGENCRFSKSSNHFQIFVKPFPSPQAHPGEHPAGRRERVAARRHAAAAPLHAAADRPPQCRPEPPDARPPPPGPGPAQTGAYNKAGDVCPPHFDATGMHEGLYRMVKSFFLRTAPHPFAP